MSSRSNCARSCPAVRMAAATFPAMAVATSLWVFSHAAALCIRLSRAATPASLPNTEDLKGLPTLLPSPVGCRIGQAVILPPAVFPLHLVHRDAVKRKDGTVFAQCTETPLPGYRADDSRQLPLEVAVPVTDGRQGQPLLPLLGRSGTRPNCLSSSRQTFIERPCS